MVWELRKNLLPDIDDTIDIGENTTPLRFRDGWFAGDLTIAGTVEISGAIVVIAKVSEVGGLVKGNVVYISGATGNKPEVSLADNTVHDKAHIFGMANEAASDGQSVQIAIAGEVGDLNTSAYTEGDRLHLVTGGGYQKDVPDGAHVHVGRVSKVNASTGIIALKLEEYAHDIRATDDLDVCLATGSDDNSKKINFENKSGDVLGYIDGAGLLQWNGNAIAAVPTADTHLINREEAEWAAICLGG